MWWWKKSRESLAVSKRATQKFDDRFNRKKLNEVEVKEQYQVKISDMFAALENLHNDVGINRAWKTEYQNFSQRASRLLQVEEA
jgi:hypothetical protein